MGAVNEMMLHCNGVSHYLPPYPELPLLILIKTLLLLKNNFPTPASLIISTTIAPYQQGNEDDRLARFIKVQSPPIVWSVCLLLGTLLNDNTTQDTNDKQHTSYYSADSDLEPQAVSRCKKGNTFWLFLINVINTSTESDAKYQQKFFCKIY